MSISFAHRFLWLALLICMSTVAVLGSEAGFSLSKLKYERVTLSPLLSTTYHDLLPYRHSLRVHCPAVLSERSSAYVNPVVAACTTLDMVYSIQNNKEGTGKPAKNSFSPYFVQYFLNSTSPDFCMVDVLEVLKQRGSLKKSDMLGGSSVLSLEQQEQAKAYRIKGYERLTFAQVDAAAIERFRESLAADMPVIAVLELPEAMNASLGGRGVWEDAHATSDNTFLHSLVVVGYDDSRRQLEVMNTWGNRWGEKGFAYIDYAVFLKYLKESYRLIVGKGTSETTASLSAKLVFQELEQKNVNGVYQCTGKVLRNMPAVERKGVYKMLNTHTEGTSYQIQVYPQSSSMFVYVLSIDATEQLDLLYPFSPDVLALYGSTTANAAVSALFLQSDASFVIPHESYCLQLDRHFGTQNVALFSSESIDIDELKAKLEGEKGDIYTRLQKVLGVRLASLETIEYATSDIGFSATLPVGKVVALVVDMNHGQSKPLQTKMGVGF